MKNINLLFFSIVFSLLAVSNPASAEECANQATTIAIADCHSARYDAADKELNAVYREAMKSLPDNAKNKLKDAQKAWLKYRDAGFAFMIEKNKDMGTYADVVVADYKAKFVEKRVLELKYILSSPEDSPVAW